MVDDLLRGHAHFRRQQVADEEGFLRALASDHQQPSAVFIGCSDSRVIPELLTTSGPGSLFVVRNIANLVPPYTHPHASVGAALEYAVGHLHVGHVVVCGHHGCGGVRALVDGAAEIEALRSLGCWLDGARPAVEAARPPNGDVATWWRRAVEQNVLQQTANLTTYPVVQQAIEAEALQLHAWVYEVRSLDLLVYDREADAFLRAAAVLSGDSEPPPG